MFQNEKQTRLIQVSFTQLGENDEGEARSRAFSLIAPEWEASFHEPFWGFRYIILQVGKFFTFNKESK